MMKPPKTSGGAALSWGPPPPGVPPGIYCHPDDTGSEILLSIVGENDDRGVQAALSPADASKLAWQIIAFASPRSEPN